MRNTNITDIKAFMNALLIKDTFDSFLLEEASITTFNTFHIDGHIKNGYFTSDETENLPDKTLSDWSSIKPVCFNLIKGTKLPLKFKIILKASASYTEKLLNEHSPALTLKDIGGLYINIRYDSNRNLTGEEITTPTLDCISMASLNIFSTDKTLEHIWDDICEKFMNSICS